jgi:pimeloyl-ACP methyl ester carboxylesterase
VLAKTLDIEGPVRIVDYGGDGSPILLLHGLAGSAENWDACGADLARLGRVIAVDLLGSGGTPPAGRAVTIEHNAALVARVIDDLGEEPAILVGHSMSGLVAMVTGVLYPDRVDRIILVNPALPLDYRHLPDLEVFVKLLGPIIPIVGPIGVHLYRVGKTPRDEVESILRMNCADIDSIPLEVRETIIDEFTERRRNGWAVPALVDADRSIATYVLRPSRFVKLMHKVSQPTLLIHGSDDRLVSSGSARWAAAQRPDWDFREMEGVGHVPMLEAADDFVAIVEEWLARD